MVPLSACLARALLDASRELERQGAAGDWPPSLLLWANLLRVIPADGLPVADLPAAARISRRAAKAWLGLERLGWLELTGPTSRSQVVRLTSIGRSARDAWADLVPLAEQASTARMGKGSATSLRRALEGFVGALAVELPHYPMPYGTDPSAVGGQSVPAKPGPPRIPAHGADWVPVVRTGGGESVHALPLHALLSQALMAFAIDYEELALFPMAMAAMLATSLPSGSRPLAELPPVLGVNGTGKSLLERHGVVQVTGSGRLRTAHLTDRGRRISQGHRANLEAAESVWRTRYGTDLVEPLATALRSVDEKLDDDLPAYVIVRFTPGLGFQDVSLSAGASAA